MFSRWFVSAARFRQLEHNAAEMRKANHVLRRANDRLRGERDEARREKAELMEMYHALRVAGGNAPAPMGEPKPDPVIDAIRERAGGNSRLERHLMREAAKYRMKNAGAEVGAVIEHVVAWRDPSAEEAG